MKKRIVFIGDFLLMPSPERGILYEDTYGYLVQKELKNYEVIINSRFSNDTTLQSEPNTLKVDIEYLAPGIVFVQLGIVDCAPRLFSRWEKIVMKYFPSTL